MSLARRSVVSFSACFCVTFSRSTSSTGLTHQVVGAGGDVGCDLGPRIKGVAVINGPPQFAAQLSLGLTATDAFKISAVCIGDFLLIM